MEDRYRICDVNAYGELYLPWLKGKLTGNSPAVTRSLLSALGLNEAWQKTSEYASDDIIIDCWLQVSEC